MLKRTWTAGQLLLATLAVSLALLVGGCTQGGPSSSGASASPAASSGSGGGY